MRCCRSLKFIIENRCGLPAYCVVLQFVEKFEKKRLRLFGENSTSPVAMLYLSLLEKRANKAPEPTTMAVTPRAIVRVIDMKPQNPNRHAARGAPATVVAHL